MQSARVFSLSIAIGIAIASVCGASTAQSIGQVGAASSPHLTAATNQRVQAPHSLVVVPAALSMSTDFAKGCWVRLYDGVDFRGQELMLVGPLQLAGMGTTSPWWRRWNSAIVGPEARLTLYSDENYAGRSAVLAARQRSTDLASKEVGWSGKIESAQVACDMN